MDFEEYECDYGCVEYEMTCPTCGKSFITVAVDQEPGFRTPSEEICPHCQYVLRSSMQYEFSSFKIDK